MKASRARSIGNDPVSLSMAAVSYSQYEFGSTAASHMHSRFMPHVWELSGDLRPDTRVLDVGCGNGFTCGEFLKRHCTVVGIDLSEQGIELARKAYPQARFEVLDAD